MNKETAGDELTTLRARVEMQQRELRGAVAELGDATRRSLELDRLIRDHPWPFLAGAFSFGFWIGSRGGD